MNRDLVADMSREDWLANPALLEAQIVSEPTDLIEEILLSPETYAGAENSSAPAAASTTQQPEQPDEEMPADSQSKDAPSDDSKGGKKIKVKDGIKKTRGGKKHTKTHGPPVELPTIVETPTEMPTETPAATTQQSMDDTSSRSRTADTQAEAEQTKARRQFLLDDVPHSIRRNLSTKMKDAPTVANSPNSAWPEAESQYFPGGPVPAPTEPHQPMAKARRQFLLDDVPYSIHRNNQTSGSSSSATQPAIAGNALMCEAFAAERLGLERKQETAEVDLRSLAPKDWEKM